MSDRGCIAFVGREGCFYGSWIGYGVFLPTRGPQWVESLDPAKPARGIEYFDDGRMAIECLCAALLIDAESRRMWWWVLDDYIDGELPQNGVQPRLDNARVSRIWKGWECIRMCSSDERPAAWPDHHNDRVGPHRHDRPGDQAMSEDDPFCCGCCDTEIPDAPRNPWERLGEVCPNCGAEYHIDYVDCDGIPEPVFLWERWGR